jgi:hypothetical protein
MITEQPIVGVKSLNQFCRKAVCDFLAGRMHYDETKRLRVDSDILDDMRGWSIGHQNRSGPEFSD